MLPAKVAVPSPLKSGRDRSRRRGPEEVAASADEASTPADTSTGEEAMAMVDEAVALPNEASSPRDLSVTPPPSGTTFAKPRPSSLAGGDLSAPDHVRRRGGRPASLHPQRGGMRPRSQAR